MADMSYRNSPNGDLAAALRALPLAAPAQGEWPRLAEAFAARQTRRRQARFAIPLAAAAVLALAFGLTRLEFATPPDAPATVATDAAMQDGTAALIARNQEMQAMLRGFDSRNAPMDGEAALASARLEDLIAMLDVELGVAPDGDAAQALWQQRLVLLQELASVRQQGQAAVAQHGDGAELVPASWVVD